MTSFFLETQSGLVLPTDCECSEDYTGVNCDLARCPETLPLVSLGLLLLEASIPEELRESSLPVSERLAGRAQTKSRIEAVFRSADRDGDDFLSVQEILAALPLADVFFDASNGSNTHVWSGAIPGRASVFPLAEDEITITEMIDQAEENFVTSGVFYPAAFDFAEPSLDDALVQMEATYPNSSYSFDRCRCRNESDDGVKLRWTFRDRQGATRQLRQQCAYVNGRRLPSSVFTNEMSDASPIEENGICKDDGASNLTTCEFHDTDGVAFNNRKRIYCVRQFFCGAGSCDQADVLDNFTATRCTTGLAFDGRPADVVPRYSISEGVQFQWLDTSIGPTSGTAEP